METLNKLECELLNNFPEKEMAELLKLVIVKDEEDNYYINIPYYQEPFRYRLKEFLNNILKGKIFENKNYLNLFSPEKHFNYMLSKPMSEILQELLEK